MASMPGTVAVADGGGGPPTRLAIADRGVTFVPEGRREDRNFVLTADFVFDRVEIADDPAALQLDAVETIAMAIDEQLPGLGSFGPIPLARFRRMSQGASEAR